jgi:hypothetical protein
VVRVYVATHAELPVSSFPCTRTPMKLATKLFLALALILSARVSPASASDPCPTDDVCLPANVCTPFDIERPPTPPYGGAVYDNSKTKVYEFDPGSGAGHDQLPFAQCGGCGAVEFRLHNHNNAHIDDANGNTIETFTCADIVIEWHYSYDCLMAKEMSNGMTVSYWTKCWDKKSCGFNACICN